MYCLNDSQNLKTNRLCPGHRSSEKQEKCSDLKHRCVSFCDILQFLQTVTLAGTLIHRLFRDGTSFGTGEHMRKSLGQSIGIPPIKRGGHHGAPWGYLLLASLVLCFENGIAQVQFAPRVAYPVSSNTSTVESGDLNGDNNIDLIVPNGSFLSIYFGNGDGTFIQMPDVDVSLGGSATDVAVEDLTGDLIPDLAVAMNGFSVLTFQGDGLGNFSFSQVLFTTGLPSQITVADFNGDALEDLAVATSGNVNLFLAASLFSYGAMTPIAAGTVPIDLIAAELNGDSNLDLAVQNRDSHDLSILLGTGSGTFNLAQTIVQLSGTGLEGQLLCDDFNGDMIPDLLSTNSSEVIWIKGLGDGTFDPPIHAGGGGKISIGDFNTDGNKDFASSSEYSNSISFYIGTGSGSFAEIPMIVGSPDPQRFIIADINHDAFPDIASSSGSTFAFYVLMGVPVTPYFNLPATTDHSNGGFTRGSLITADVSGDGNLDMITSNNGNIAVLYGTGQGCFSSPRTFPASSNVLDIYAADLNADGKTDIVSANGTDFNISVFLNNGSGFAPRVQYGTGPGTDAGSQSLAVADVDGDGKLDVLTVNNNSSGTISVLRGNGDGTFNPYTQYAVDPGPVAIGVGDLNGDLKPDLVVACPSSYTVNVLMNDGSGGFPTYSQLFTNRPTDVVLVDFNHDTHIDLLYSGSTQAGWLLNDGSGGFSPDTGISMPGFSIPGNLKTGDFNGDGNIDIVAGGPQYNTSASIVFGDGLGAFQSVVSYSAGYYTVIRDVVAGDFDEDGKSDFAVLASDFFINAAITTYRTASAACTPPPYISSISPSSGAAGTVVNIFGGSFDDTPANNIVRFNGVPATVTISNCCFLSVVVPLGATTGNLTVQVGTFTTFNPVTFTIPAPAITSFTPSFATTGESVTITGNGFSPVNAINVVRFNGTVATVTASSPTSITATVPVGATTGPISVTVDGQMATSGSNFTFVLPPTISGFTPSSAPPVTSITISGANFDPVPANNTVRINGALMTVTSSTATSIVADIPASATSGLITVTVMGYTGTSSTYFQVITPPPTITGFSPATGPVGTTVTITGTNFNLVAANNFVRFGAVNANVSSVTATTMVVTVPVGASYHPISLTINEFQCESKVPFITTFESFQTIDINSFNPMTPGGTPSRRAVAGDINGDGSIDYVAAMMDFPVYNLRVISGSQFVNLPTAVSNLTEALQDINGDGKPDLLAVTGNGFGNTLHVFKNTSVPGIINSGTFAARIDLAYGNANRILIKDIDGDGKPDVIRSQNTPAFVVHRNTSQFGVIDATSLATLVTVATSSNITIADVGDVDGDGKPDLVTTGGSFFRNTSTPGNISFDPKQDLITGTVVYVLADINRDEKLDVIGNNGVLLNTSMPGSFSFATMVSISITTPFSVKVADLDGDGLPDLAYASNRISVVKNTSSATTASFLPKVDFGDTYDYIGTNLGGALHSILDIDGDGKLDLLYLNNGYITNALVTGSPSRVPVVSGFSPASGPVGATVTISGSNFSATPSSNIVYFGAVKATVTSASATAIDVTVPPGSTDKPISVTVNGFSGYSRNPFVVLFNTDGVINTSMFASPISYGAWSFPLGLSIGDVNGDGKPDIGSADAAGSAVSVFQNNTTMGVFNASSLLSLVAYNTGAAPTEVELVDMDGDGRLDLTSTCETLSLPNGRVSINRNVTGTGTINSSFFGGAAQSLANFRPRGLAVGDVDGDGKPDMVAITLTEDRVHIYKNISGLGTSKSSHRENSAILTSSGASSVALSDLDVDGKLDLIVMYDGPFISIFRNTSTVGLVNPNSFGSRIDIPVPFTTGFARIAVGDLDGDGRPDIVKPNPGNNTVSILKNISTPGSITTGSFNPSFELTTGSAPSSATIGDLDGDGKREIAVTNETSNTFSLFKNVSVAGTLDASSFLSKVDFSTPAGPQRIAIGDLDGDIKPDLVVSCPGADVISIFHNEKILLGGGVPTITSFSPTSAMSGATVTITGTNFIGATAVSFGGTAALSFTVNSSTSIDAVVGAGSSGIVSVTTPDGTGTLPGFTLLNPPGITGFSPASGPVGTAVTITGTYFSSTPANNIVYFGATRATVTAATTTQLTVNVPVGATYQPITVQVAGLTGYSSKPFLVTFGGGGSVDACSFAPKVNFATGTTPWEILIADFDGDGKSDVALANRNSKTLLVYRSTSTTGSIDASTLEAPISRSTPFEDPLGLVAADMDGDGKLDIVLSNAGASSPVSVYRNTSVTGSLSFDNRFDYSTGGIHGMDAAVRDLDNDGKPEIVVCNRFGNSVSVFKNTSTPGGFTASSFAAKVDFTVGSQPYGVAIEDLDGDGKPDIVTANTASTTVSVLRNTAVASVINSGSFAVKVDFTTEASPTVVSLSDVDGDDKPDIVVTGGGGLSILKNISTSGITPGSFAAKVDFSSGGLHAAADIDGDAKVDIVALTPANDNLSAFRNTTITGTISSTSLASAVGFVGGPGPIAVGDLDGDGKPDVIASDINTNSMYILRNVIGEFSPPSITSFSPISGVAGISVTLTGSNFSTPFTSNVAFNGLPATITASNATSITVTVPSGVTTGPIMVTIGCNSASSPSIFNVCSLSAPTVTDGNHCGPGAVVLSASGAAAGQEYRWYDVPSAGTSQGILAAFTTPSITTTGTYYASIFETATGCESTRAAAVANIRTVPAAPGVTGGASCTPSAFTLGATGGVNGDYRWYTVSTGGTAMAGEVNDTYVTPLLSATTNYFVTLANAFCESNPRTTVTAAINTVPAPVIATTNCTAVGATLDGPLGFTGYLWSTGATTPQITVTSAGSYTLIVTSAAGCTSPASSAVTFTPFFCNQAPVGSPGTASTTVQVPVTVNLGSLIADPDNNLDFTSLKVVGTTLSGASASINSSGDLVVDYSTTPFAGTDRVTLEICDMASVCTQFEITIEVAGEIVVFNAVSPNHDGKNDTFVIQHIGTLPDTKKNKITIVDRTGNVVFEALDYDNTSVVFTGKTTNGSELPSGVYYYTIEFSSGIPKRTGFLSLRK